MWLPMRSRSADLPSSARPTSRDNDRVEDDKAFVRSGDGGVEEAKAALGGDTLSAAVVERGVVRTTRRMRRRSSTPAAPKAAAMATAAKTLPAMTGTGELGEPSGDTDGLGK